MKKVLIFLVSVLLSSVQPSAVPAREQPTVVFVNPGKHGEVFWDLVSETMQAAAKQLSMNVEIVYAERNHRVLREIGLEVIARPSPPDYLVLVNEEAAATPVIEAANRAGIKTFLLSNAFTGAEADKFGPPRTILRNWIGSLVPDMNSAGARMAKALVDIGTQRNWLSADGKLHLLALGGDERTPNSIARTEGLTAYVAGRSDVVLDRLLFANWNAAEAGMLTDRYLHWAEHAGIRPAGIWAANDPMAMGAIDAIQRNGLAPGQDIAVVGLNWSPEALDQIQSGRLALTDGGHFFAGGWSMVMLRDHADGCDFAQGGAAKVFPLASIDRSNLSELAETIRGHKFGSINFESFLASRRGHCGEYDFTLDALLRASHAAMPDGTSPGRDMRVR